MQALFDLGMQVAHGCMSARSLATLNPYLNDIINGDASRASAAESVVMGAAMAFAKHCEAAKRQGVRFTPDTPTPEAMVYAAGIGRVAYMESAALIFGAVLGLFDSPIDFRMEQRRPSAAAAYSPSLPEGAIKITEIERDEFHEATRMTEWVEFPGEVRRTYEKVERGSADPIKVQVVAMPARITDTSIERNSSGEIVSSQQVERDV